MHVEISRERMGGGGGARIQETGRRKKCQVLGTSVESAVGRLLCGLLDGFFCFCFVHLGSFNIQPAGRVS